MMGVITFEECEEAIANIRLAQEQLAPDGGDCKICGDCGHQAFECHHNPIVLMRRTRTAETEFWCYFCGEVFRTDKEAQEHFGERKFNPEYPTCVEKLQATVDRLIAAEDNCWDIRCIDVPTGGDDYDIEWVVIEHYMSDQKEREIGRGKSICDAISNAMETTGAAEAVKEGSE